LVAQRQFRQHERSVAMYSAWVGILSRVPRAAMKTTECIPNRPWCDIIAVRSRLLSKGRLSSSSLGKRNKDVLMVSRCYMLGGSSPERFLPHGVIQTMVDTCRYLRASLTSSTAYIGALSPPSNLQVPSCVTSHCISSINSSIYPSWHP
jgi:hypothetical protein